MKVLNIHGYNGSAFNSVAVAMELNGLKVVTENIDYDGTDPEIITEHLLEIYLKNKCEAIAGTSLGGFYAMVLCARLSVPTLLINPAVVPGIVLPELGYAYPDGIRKLRAIELKYLGKLDLNNITTIVGKKDEIINDRLRAYTKAVLFNNRYYEIPNGKHSGSTLGLNALIKTYRKEWFGDVASDKDI